MENDGGSPPSFTQRVIAVDTKNVVSVFAADVDGDGDVDVLAASRSANQIVWYESNGGSPPDFTKHVVSNNPDKPFSVLAADMDGDGDTDILSTSSGGPEPTPQGDEKIVWYENVGGSPPTFIKRVIPDNVYSPSSVSTADVDGDGDTDVLCGSTQDDMAVWYENDGGAPPMFTERVISPNADGVVSLVATDVDGDGDIDALSALQSARQVVWYESDGGSPPSFIKRVISSNTNGVVSLIAADVDGDGDIDALSLSRTANEVAWYENVGGSPPSFNRHVIWSGDRSYNAFAGADMEGDGDFDLVAVSGGTVNPFVLLENNNPPCENGFVNPGEECDGGAGCTNCSCDAGFEPTTPPSFDCKPTTCGDGLIDPLEECDGGLDCTNCLCDAGFIPTFPPSINCFLSCGNGSIDPGEECEGGLDCTGCLCDEGFESTTPISADCRVSCGDGDVDPGEECDGADDSACPGGCLSDCTCGLCCGDLPFTQHVISNSSDGARSVSRRTWTATGTPTSSPHRIGQARSRGSKTTAVRQRSLPNM